MCRSVIQDGKTALHWAARHGHTAIVQVLLDAGADVNIKSKVSGVRIVGRFLVYCSIEFSCFGHCFMWDMLCIDGGDGFA